eukprot:4210986-Amphidinium_carterae.1
MNNTDGNIQRKSLTVTISVRTVPRLCLKELALSLFYNRLPPVVRARVYIRSQDKQPIDDLTGRTRD